jgi:hypothetical protein
VAIDANTIDSHSFALVPNFGDNSDFIITGSGLYS